MGNLSASLFLLIKLYDGDAGIAGGELDPDVPPNSGGLRSAN